jgi:hypothetical protein
VLADVAQQVTGESSSPEEIAVRLVRHFKRTLTFEPGTIKDHALIPKPTAQIVKASSAAHLDRAAVLLAALRARGLQADLALAQWLFRTTDDLPTLDWVDSVLVVVTGPGLKAPMWIDVGSGRMPNDVSDELRGASALPIRPKGSGLMVLPPARATRSSPSAPPATR